MVTLRLSSLPSTSSGRWPCCSIAMRLVGDGDAGVTRRLQRACQLQAAEQLRRQRAPQAFARLGAVDAAVVAGALEGVAHGRGEDRADRVDAAAIEQAGRGRRSAGSAARHRAPARSRRGRTLSGNAASAASTESARSLPPMQVAIGLSASACQPGQCASPSASATTAPCDRRMREQRAATHAASNGWPATSRYCFGMSPPKRVPRPAAGTIAQITARPLRSSASSASAGGAGLRSRPRDRTSRPA